MFGLLNYKKQYHTSKCITGLNINTANINTAMMKKKLSCLCDIVQIYYIMYLLVFLPKNKKILKVKVHSKIKTILLITQLHVIPNP